MLRVDDVSGGSLLLFLLLPLLFIALSLGVFALMLRAMGMQPLAAMREEDGGRWERLPRPWWGSPLLWLGIAGVFLLLGLFVFPQVLGGTFLFLPFFWLGGWRGKPRIRRQAVSCPSCGAPLHPEHDDCPQCGAPVRRGARGSL